MPSPVDSTGTAFPHCRPAGCTATDRCAPARQVRFRVCVCCQQRSAWTSYSIDLARLVSWPTPCRLLRGRCPSVEAPQPGFVRPAARHKPWRAGSRPGKRPVNRSYARARLPNRDDAGRTTWVTLACPKVTRIACPWLIRRFLDPKAVILLYRHQTCQPSPVVSTRRRSKVGKGFGATARPLAHSTSCSRNLVSKRNR